MVDQTLLDRLDQLHEELKNQAILEEVAKLPQEEQLDYQIQSRIGRALGNLHQHQAAFRVLRLARPGRPGPGRGVCGPGPGAGPGLRGGP